jgi:hypothetical protein
MNHARTYEKAIVRNGVEGLRTIVFFSDGVRTVTDDFMKDGRNKAKKLIEMGKR